MKSSILNIVRDLNKRCSEGESANSLAPDIRDCLHDYVRSNCLHPIKIKYRDKLTYELKPIYVPCGKCYNCRSKIQGEWASRMILHTNYCAKHCYFVTLSYGSYDSYEDVPKVLRNAYYRLDDYNFNKRLAYSPCLIRHEHVQRFMKYLRKFHTDRIDFFCGSEYGKDFGRPHHHLILWSNTPISKDLICKCWSCRYKRTKYSTLIGRVDYNDLNANGTIIHDGINFGNDMKNCFMYVAKYICKQYVDPNNKIDSRSRLNYFIYDLAHGLIDKTLLNDVLDLRIRRLAVLLQPWADHLADYIREREYKALCTQEPYYLYDMFNNKVKIYPNISKYIFNKSIYYDYETPSHSFLLCPDIDEHETASLLSSFYLEVSPLVFRKVFAPRCVSSRNPAIGVEYFERHYKEYISGNFTLPKYDNGNVSQTLLFPRLFVRKTKEYLFRYAFLNKSLLNQKRAPELVANPHVFTSNFPQISVISSNEFVYGSIIPHFNPTDFEQFDKLLRTNYAFIDYLTKTRCLAFIDNDFKTYVAHYRYNKTNRCFEYVYKDSFEDFVNSIIELLKVSKPLQELFTISIENSYDDFNFFFNNFPTILESVLNTSFTGELLSSYDLYLTQLKQHSDVKNINPKSEFRKL